MKRVEIANPLGDAVCNRIVFSAIGNDRFPGVMRIPIRVGSFGD